jgi:hypothetical protein
MTLSVDFRIVFHMKSGKICIPANISHGFLGSILLPCLLSHRVLANLLSLNISILTSPI